MSWVLSNSRILPWTERRKWAQGNSISKDRDPYFQRRFLQNSWTKETRANQDWWAIRAQGVDSEWLRTVPVQSLRVQNCSGHLYHTFTLYFCVHPWLLESQLKERKWYIIKIFVFFPNRHVVFHLNNMYIFLAFTN